MIWGILAKRRNQDGGTPFNISRMAALVISTASRSYSNADVSLLGLVAARRMNPQMGRADVSLVGLTTARRQALTRANATVSEAVLTAARVANEPPTNAAASRMSVLVIHS